MIFKEKKENLLDEFINDFAEAKLSKAELQSFSELTDNDPELRHIAISGIKARKNLRNLRKIKSRPGFDQRMAAKFSMELEREIMSQNSSLHSVARA
jgi:hypothetical protein